MTVDTLCKEIMSNSDIPMSKRVELVREIRIHAKPTDTAKSVLKALASIYMGYAWSKSTGANKLIGSYIGYLISKKL